MKLKNELIILIGSFLFSSYAQASNEQIKVDCQKVAAKMCGSNCVEPEEPSTFEYPEWWSQAMKNKEWHKRIELKKLRKEYDIAISSQQPYIDYCVAKEEDMKKNQTVNAMVQQKELKHENIFYSWNKYRLAELESNTLTFNVLEQDRDIYNKRYSYYKRNTFEKVKKSFQEFAEKEQLARRIDLFEGRHKNVEIQNEFLSLLASDLTNFTAFFDAKSKFERQSRLLDKAASNRELETLNLTEQEEEMLVKYLTLIERKDEKSINKIKEKYQIKVDN